MRSFRYKATTETGHPSNGVIEAEDRETAARQLQRQGLLPLSIQESSPEADRGRRPPAKGSRRSRREAVDIFTLELATLLKSGLSLGQGLDALAELASDQALSETIGRIRDGVRRGKPLSTALEEANEQLFDPFYRSMIRAGENSGALPVVLERLAAFRIRRRELQKELISILLYPAILVVLSLIAIGVLLGFVVPQFAEMFAESGQSLPLLTRIVAGIGHFIATWWWLLFGVLVVSALFLRNERHTPEGRMRQDRWLLGVPMVAEFVRKAESARFLRTLATMLENGVPLVEAIELAADIVSNTYMAEALRHVGRRVREGASLSQALDEGDTLPVLARKLIGIGETSGQLVPMLERVADIFEKDMKTSLQRLLTVAEPAIIVTIAIIITAIILSVILVILESNELAF